MQVKTRALIFQTYISVINHEKNNISHSLTGNSEIHHPLTNELSVFQILACVAGACLLLARPFFLVPTTSKRLLRRLFRYPLYHL